MSKISSVEVEVKENGTSKVESVFNGIRGSIHPELYKRLLIAEEKMQIKDRGILLDMALRSFFALTPVERAKSFDMAVDERAKLEDKGKPTERDFNF